MKLTALSIFFLSILAGCANGKKAQPGDETVPACIREQIAEFEKQPAANLPIQVDEYNYSGKRVFLFTADCCDQYNNLYDENCQKLCAPSGGLAGRGDGKCNDFKDAAKLVRTIWKKKEK